MSVGEVKAELRQFVRLTRAARSSAEREESTAGFGIAMTTLVAEEGWGRVAAFIPTATEPPVTDTLAFLVESGIETFVPVSNPDGILDWIRLERGFVDDMTTDSMNMPIPTSGDRGPLTAIDAVFVPAAAVDRNGHRLGWGKGYYDRFLSQLDPTTFVVAVVFDADILADIPVEPHDVGVDIIITERDVYTVQ
ncbi:MAG: 5-formyltetrahydrofolate cyclo-ligase [Microbacteriaceae bacterium]